MEAIIETEYLVHEFMGICFETSVTKPCTNNIVVHMFITGTIKVPITLIEYSLHHAHQLLSEHQSYIYNKKNTLQVEYVTVLHNNKCILSTPFMDIYSNEQQLISTITNLCFDHNPYILEKENWRIILNFNFQLCKSAHFFFYLYSLVFDKKQIYPRTINSTSMFDISYKDKQRIKRYRNKKSWSDIYI